METHATDEIVAETESKETRFAQPSDITLSQFTEELVTKTLRFEHMYEKTDLNEIFIEDLDASIRHSVREYWRGKNKANLHNLVSNATSLFRLQGHDISSKGTNQSNIKQQKKLGKS